MAMRSVAIQTVCQKGVISKASQGGLQSTTLSFRLCCIIYPLVAPLGTLPIPFGSRTISFEFVLTIAAAILFFGEVIRGTLRLPKCNTVFLTGIILWLFASTISVVLNDGGSMATSAVVRLGLKAAFSYMVFAVLANNGRLTTLLWAYLIGCALAGLFTLGFLGCGGNLEMLRQTTYAGLERSNFELNIFNGLASTGASNLAPLWISVALLSYPCNQSNRRFLLFLIPYFLLLSLLSLRREVLIEGSVGLLLIWSLSPGRRRFQTMLVGLVMVCLMGVVVLKSERWQERLFVETRDQFETRTDPRLVLLTSTPVEFVKAPWFGQGPESYRWLMLNHLPVLTSKVREYGIAAHNTFSKAAVETGSIGLLGVILMCAGLARRGCLSRHNVSPENYFFKLTAMLMLLKVGTAMFFQDGSVSNSTWYFFGILLYLDWKVMHNNLRMSKSNVPSPSTNIRHPKESV